MNSKESQATRFIVGRKCVIGFLAVFMLLSAVITLQARADNAGTFYNQNGNWYYYAPNGSKLTGWQKDHGYWYYMDPSSGIMQTGWKRINGNWYYLRSTGEMKTGWVESNGWYYLKSDGSMATGWTSVNGKWYYLGSDGRMRTGWVQLGENWYYLRSDGSMATGWLSLNGKWFYLHADGHMENYQATIGGKEYYFDLYSGEWLNGWVQRVNLVDRGYYWEYYKPEGGKCCNEWAYINGSWYYFVYESMAASVTLHLDDALYMFDANGHYQKTVIPAAYQNVIRAYEQYYSYQINYSQVPADVRQGVIGRGRYDSYSFPYTCYTLLDVNKDGVMELLVADASFSTTQDRLDVGIIHDIWTISNGKAVFVTYADTRFSMTPTTTGYFAYQGSSGYNNSSCYLYRLNSNGTLTSTYSCEIRNGSYYVNNASSTATAYSNAYSYIYRDAIDLDTLRWVNLGNRQ